ncbi:MAG: DUF1800 domain-containing protein [Steroidobacteraceae bacterium]
MHLSNIARLRALAAVLATALAVAGCGGGSGGGGSGPTPNPPPPITRGEAYRFLNQATFGATEAEANRLIALGDSETGYARWIDEQIAQPVSLELPTLQQELAAAPDPIQALPRLHASRQEQWYRYAITGPDQLRQRVAFALSEIMVVSQQSAADNMPLGLADYYDTLARDAFGDFRELMEHVSLHPAMGIYLNMLGNRKPNEALNIRPDENYARELMQLFSIGLVQLNADGTPKLDGSGQPIPTYDQSVVEGFANVYTGWNYAGFGSFAAARRTLSNDYVPMQPYEEEHSPLGKKLLSYPGATTTQLPPGGTARQDLEAALDNIYNHPNVGPFISKQLIQRLVTSNPSPQYVARVASVFNRDAQGRRGNLGAVVKAILLDPEARNAPTGDTFGKVKEPLLRLTALWRAYGAKASTGKYAIGNLSVVFGQSALQSPSVFNFFSPFYAPPGEIADRGLVAPEMQIATEYLNTSTTNIFFGVIYGWNSTVAGLPPEAVVMDFSEEVALAADSARLVDRIRDKLLGGRISATLETEARAGVDRIPAAFPGYRVSEALYLIATSPEFVVQR